VAGAERAERVGRRVAERAQEWVVALGGAPGRAARPLVRTAETEAPSVVAAAREAEVARVAAVARIQAPAAAVMALAVAANP
jgi:hypothetical protein